MDDMVCALAARIAAERPNTLEVRLMIEALLAERERYARRFEEELRAQEVLARGYFDSIYACLKEAQAGEETCAHCAAVAGRLLGHCVPYGATGTDAPMG